jgi:pyruvate kinase
MKKTKIVATIGPASKDKETLRKMIQSGMNVARLNFSHGEHQWHQEVIDDVRSLSEEMNLPVGIMADLQGPRIRTIVDGETELIIGENIIVYGINDSAQISNSKFLISDKIPNSQNSKMIGLDYPGVIKDIEVGNTILIEDGLKSVHVIRKEDGYLEAQVIDGGIVGNHKGVNIPDAKLGIPAITEKDEKDLEFALKNEVDFVAMSFVSNFDDIFDLKKKIRKILKRDDNLPQVVAKIERKEAIENLNGIIKATDAVMVARGDLGIEMKEAKVIILQKEIIKKSIDNLKPVIVATEMLSSMVENPRPTRAEVSDVTNAVIDHADAVMLSAESASGKHPIEAVMTMSEIILSTEESPYDDMYDFSISQELSNEYVDFIRGTCNMLFRSDAKTIAVLSRGGFTARVISHFRPNQLILTGTNNERTYFQSSLVWGIRAYLFKDEKIDEMIEKMLEKASKEKVLNPGDNVVVIGKNAEKGFRFVNLKEVK